ncbi:MAG: M56 family metallopeptidase [Planctomycetota bacterium]
MATALALLVFPLTRVCRKPALSHCLWILVLVKLVTPPIVSVPLPVSWVPGTGQEHLDPAALLPPIEVPRQPSHSTAVAGAPSIRNHPPAMDAVETDVGGLSQGSSPVLAARNSAPSAGDSPGYSLAGPRRDLEARRLRPADLVPLLAGAWLTGTLWVLTVTGVRIFQFQRALRAATPAPVFLRVEVEALAKRLGVRRRPKTFLVPAAISPMLWAPFGEATVLFPAKLLERLEAEGRQALLLHELAHLRRRDHRVRIVEAAATAFYWWHPVVWWARREIQLAEEACCDSWVVSEMPDRRETYAAALVEAVRFLSHPPSLLPLPTSGSSFVAMKERVTTIMLADSPKRLSLLGWIIVTALAAACLPLLVCPV